VFVAAEHRHQTNFPDVQLDPTLKTIAEVTSLNALEVIVVEGLRTGNELSPKSILKRADACESSRYRACGEDIFAINQARKHHIAFISGEPSETTIRDEVHKAGYTVQDLLGFYVLRQLAQFTPRAANMTETELTKEIDRILVFFRKQLGTKARFGVGEFKDWYSEHAIRNKSFSQVDTGDVGPADGPAATYIQRISHQVSLIRDRAIVKTVERMLESFDRVLVVYGGSHLLRQEPAFAEAMGSAAYSKLY
jgi:hypothetical protein